MVDWDSLGLIVRKDGILLPVKVQASANRNELVGIYNGTLKIRLTTAPVRNQANLDLLKWIGRILSVPKHSVTLVQGHQSSHKRLKIQGLNREEIIRRLAQHLV